jgi:predicted nucleic acid-binding protein
VLADSGPLYAALDPGDTHHERAQHELTMLEAGELSVVALFPTLLESYTLVLRRLGFQVASGFVKEMFLGSVPLNPEPDDYLKAARRVRTHPDQPITLFDAVLAVVSDRLRLPVWTYDQHFDVMAAEDWRG